MPQSLSEQLAGTPLFGANASYVETLYEQYLQRPESVEPSWRAYFDALRVGAPQERPHRAVIAALAARAQASTPPTAGGGGASEKQAAVSRLMQIYSNRGHLIARIDPLGLLQRPRPRRARPRLRWA